MSPTVCRCWILLATLVCPSVPLQAANLAVPDAHPRIWYGGQAGTPGAHRLARARAFAASQPVPISNADESIRNRDRALRSLISGNPADGCNEAVAWMRTFNFPSQNEARWDGENAILIFDWCYAHIPAADRSTITGNWNASIAALNARDWGGPSMAANNYFWGYLRNSLLWGIASLHHNPQAQGFIDHALDLRYRSLSTPPLANGSKFWAWYQGFGIGGVALEGSGYGIAMLDYPVIAFTTASDYGYDAWNAVPFWRDAVYYLQYAGTPAPTQIADNASARYELFPFNEDEAFRNGGTAERSEYGNFLGGMILRNPNVPTARQARTWMDARGITPPWWVRSELASTTVTTALPTRPIDYYAAGAQFFYGRSSAAADATTFHLQLGSSESDEAGGGVGHQHLDAGNFQLWRKGRWITRETTGYLDNILGWNNGPAVDVREAVAHNTVLFEGRGQIDSRSDWSNVLRLQTSPGFAYAAVDLTRSYRADEARRDWPYAEVAIREFVYLRSLETLVVLDRLRSGSDSLNPDYDGHQGPDRAGSAVRKTFVLHAGGSGTTAATNPFTLGSARAAAVVGTQRLDLQTLLPAAPAYRVVREGSGVGQYRLEYDVSGTETTYFLNVVSARDAVQTQAASSMQDLGGSWQLTLSHPQKGNATILFQKGEFSSGGSVRINSGAAVAMRANVQGMLVGESGVTWAGVDAAPGRVTGGALLPRSRSGTAPAGVYAPVRLSPSSRGGRRGAVRQTGVPADTHSKGPVPAGENVRGAPPVAPRKLRASED